MRTVTVTPHGLSLSGTHHRLLSGEVHYWRHDPSEWLAIIDAVSSLGFTTISTYCSWARHEQSDGSFSTEESLNVVEFLRLVEQRGLKAVMRVGPDSACEQQDSGWPARVLDDPACQALRPGGFPYLLASATGHGYMPSYASHATWSAITQWYDAVASWIAPLQHPDGPVIAVQVDNEIGYHFQSHAYALDYHPDAITQYQAFLRSRYDDLDALNVAYGTGFPMWEAIDPPRDGVADPAPWHIDWIRFKEHHLRDTLARLCGLLRERGIDRVPLVHNDYPRRTTPQDLGLLERSGAVDLAGADIYARKESGTAVRDLAQHLSGSSVLPYMAELGTGWLTLPWLLPLATEPIDEEHSTLRAFLHGVRAANVYQLVERDRWYGSPISSHGEVRPKASLYSRLHVMLDALSWERLRRDAPVLLVENRALARRIAARARHGNIVPCFSQVLPIDMRLLDVDDREADAVAAWNKAQSQACMDAGFEADRASSDALPDLERYAVVAVLRPELLERPIVHPTIVSSEAALSEALAKIDPPAFRCDVPGVEVIRLTGDGREVVAVINGTPEPIESQLRFEGRAAFSGRWYEEELDGDGVVSLRLAPWSGQVWEVHR